MRELLGRAYVKRAERLLYEIKALIDVHWPGGGLPAVPGLVSLIEQDLGRKISIEVARMLVVYLKRAGGQSQYSALLAAQAQSDSATMSSSHPMRPRWP